MKTTKTTMIALMLSAAFLISRPALAGDDQPKTEKSDKASKKSDKKKDDKAATPPAKDDKKADKAGW
jgi:hypothetical protein